LPRQRCASPIQWNARSDQFRAPCSFTRARVTVDQEICGVKIVRCRLARVIESVATSSLSQPTSARARPRDVAPALALRKDCPAGTAAAVSGVHSRSSGVVTAAQSPLVSIALR
jgi:hypothetical protein